MARNSTSGMPPKLCQRRALGLILLAMGSLPFVAAAVVIVLGTIGMPGAFLRLFDVFVPAGVDAPDNWAVAITRMVWLFIVAATAGVALQSLGLWLARPAPPGWLKKDMKTAATDCGAAGESA